jgi:2-polyprenyl-3-methyl-5-hydroxy-6-metoxy-1,4-benzoquinol methylase
VSIAAEPFSVHRCVVCGLGQTQPIPEDLSPYYENYYGGRHSFSARYRASRRLARVSRYVNDGLLLDIGYGEGTFLEFAATQGFECVGVERFSGSNERTFATFEDLEAARQAYPTRKFSAITCWHSLEHVTDADDVLANICEMLADDGSLFIAVPNFASRQAEMFGKDWLHLDVPRHLVHFTEMSIEKMLRKHDLHIADVWHHESEYDIMGWSQSFLNKIFSEKNVFFNTLTGKATDAGAATKVIHFLIGSIASVAAIPLVLLDIVTKRGGTIVVRATKHSS